MASSTSTHDIAITLTKHGDAANQVKSELLDAAKAGNVLAQSAGAADRAIEGFADAISGLKPGALKDLERSLGTIQAEAAAAGLPIARIGEQIKMVQGKISADAAAGTMWGRLKENIAGAASEIPGLSRGMAALANPLGAIATGAIAAGAAFAGFVRHGIAFNSTVQTAQIGIAAVMMQFDKTGQIATFAQAMSRSGEAIELLKMKAAESPATFEQLVSGLQSVSGAATQAGFSMQQQVSFITQMSQTLAGLGIRTEQITQESRAFLTGDITEDAAAARMLGIRREDIELAKQQGKLYEMLMSKTAAFSAAGKAGAETLNTAWTNVQDSLSQMAGAASRPIFDVLTMGAVGLSQTLAKLNVMLGITSPNIGSAGDSAAAAAPALEKVTVAIVNAETGMVELVKVQKELKTTEPVSEMEKLRKKTEETTEAMRGLQQAELERINAEAGLKLAELNRSEAREIREAKAAGASSEDIAVIKARYEKSRAEVSSGAEIKKSEASVQEARNAEAQERGNQAAEKDMVTEKDLALSQAQARTKETTGKAQAMGLANDDDVAISEFDRSLKAGTATPEQANAAADARKRKAAGQGPLGYKKTIGQLQRAKDGAVSLGIPGQAGSAFAMSQWIKEAQKSGDWSVVDANTKTEDQRYLVGRAKQGKTFNTTDPQDMGDIAADATIQQSTLTQADAALTNERQADAAAKDARQKYDAGAKPRENRMKAAETKTQAAEIQHKTVLTNVAARKETTQDEVVSAKEDQKKASTSEADDIRMRELDEKLKGDMPAADRETLWKQKEEIESRGVERKFGKDPARLKKEQEILAARRTNERATRDKELKKQELDVQEKDLENTAGNTALPPEMREKARQDLENLRAQRAATSTAEQVKQDARTVPEAKRIESVNEKKLTQNKQTSVVLKGVEDVAGDLRGKSGTTTAAAANEVLRMAADVQKDGATDEEVQSLLESLSALGDVIKGKDEKREGNLKKVVEMVERLQDAMADTKGAVKNNRR